MSRAKAKSAVILCICLLSNVALAAEQTAPTPAQNSADVKLKPLTAHEGSAQNKLTAPGKTAFFNSSKVAAALPSQRRRQLLKAQAESQLRQAAKEAIDVLQKMRKDGRTEAEISAEETRRKVLVENQQKALGEIVGKADAESRAEIEEAVASIAEARGYALVLDLDGIYFGGGEIKNAGHDITGELILKIGK